MPRTAKIATGPAIAGSLKSMGGGCTLIEGICEVDVVVVFPLPTVFWMVK